MRALGHGLHPLLDDFIAFSPTIHILLLTSPT